jgi:Secretion system C-terminal sorting domain
MKNKLLMLAWVGFPLLVGAQCTVAIPANATVINQDSLFSGINEHFWVCTGDTLGGSGYRNSYYVEIGGAISNMSGIEKKVYLKSGAYMNTSGIDDTVYYEAGAVIVGSGHVGILCSSIVFDYTNAPAGGCVVTDVHAQVATNDITVYPNPVTNLLTIESSGKNIRAVRIFDMTGKEIQRKTYNQKAIGLDITDFDSGIYFLEIETSEGIEMRRIVKA